MSKDELLRAIFDAAVAAADPALRVPPFLPKPPRGRTIVIGAGKASAAMALAVEQNWKGPLEGLVITRYGHGAPCKHIEIVEAAHPVPDEAGRNAALRMAKMVRDGTGDDLHLCVISGGGSALLAAPTNGLTLADKQSVNRQLLASGAPIGEMNTVRKHLSALKGGRLAAAAYPAKVVSLIISDVPGDDPSVVASGPTVPDPSLAADALAVLEQYHWPGNIRELDNVIARAVILSQTDVIEPEVLALDLTSCDGNTDALSYLRLPYHESMEAHSRRIIEQALHDADGNQTKAAERLKLQRTYLARLLRQQRQKLEEKDGETYQDIEQAARP